jgi:hypothetical protein
MRDFTKSMFSFSWALSLFGVQQMANMMMAQAPDRSRSKATEAFDCVTRATEEQLGDTLKETFKAADKLQRGMVDMMFGAWMTRDRMTGASPENGQETAGCCGSGMPWRPGDNQQGAGGWGPIPAADAPAAETGS